jgi:hypothetical protein
MYPNWVLFLNSGFGFIGLFIGYKTIKQKIRIKTAIITDLIILLLGGLIKLISVM